MFDQWQRPHPTHCRRFVPFCWIFLFIGVVFTTSVQGAGHFDVRPLRVELEAPDDIDMVELGNRGSTPVVIQAEVRSWTQVDGRNNYLPSDALLVSPPIFEIQPGDRQVVRVGLRQPVINDVETAYRIFFSEVPPQRPQDVPATTGVAISLRLAIPVFVLPEKIIEPPLQATIHPLDDDRVELTLLNPANLHVQLRRLRCEEEAVEGLEGQEPALGVSQVVGYLLAGTKRTFALDSNSLSVAVEQRNCRLVAESDRGLRPIEIQVLELEENRQ